MNSVSKLESSKSAENNEQLKPPSMQIFITSCDRPKYLYESLSSALAQDASGIDLEVIVSDNSTNNDVEEMMQKHFPNVRYVKRWPQTTEHLHRVINEATADFIVIFHDDDVLLPQYSQKMMQAFRKYPAAAAIGSNAIVIDGKGVETRLFNTHKTDRVIECKKWFMSQYIERCVEENGSVPYPSYCYRRTSLDLKHFNIRDGGQYSDGPFVAKKLEYGPIVWLAEPLMKYRWHGENGSASIEINQARQQWRYMTSVGIDRNDIEFKKWRRTVWYDWYFQRQGRYKMFKPIIPLSWKERVVQKTFLTTPYPMYKRTLRGKIIRYIWYILTCIRMLNGYILASIRRVWGK